MSEDTPITRKELNIYAKNKGIKEPHKMSTHDLIHIHTLHIQDIKLKSHCIRGKINRLNLKKIGKKQNVSKRDLREVTKLHNMSLDDLKKIAILRRIKNYNNLSKEDLIYTILRSESSPAENNYIKCINDNANDKIKAKINNIRITLSRLGNIVTKNDRDKIRKELYEIEKRKGLTKTQKERIYSHIVGLANALDKINKYKYSNHDDLDYFGISNIDNLFNDIDDAESYKPLLIKSSFENNYEYYEI